MELIASAATHAVLPLIATAPGRRLQIDAGLRSHRAPLRRHEGFWLPECAYRPGIERLLAEREPARFCVDQSAHEPPLASLAPVRTRRPGRVHDRLGGVALVWVARGYPSDPRTSSSTACR